jgi:hypothetical protein
MRIYVAGRTKNIEEVNLIQSAAIDHGHEITHDWTDVEGEGKGEIRSDWSSNPERARQVATLDFLGVTQAQGVILCGYGCDEENKGGLGCFIEVGIALASGVPVIVLGPARESVFWYSPFTLKVFKDEPLEIESDAYLEDRIRLETAVALDGLESLNRKKRLALSESDTTVRMP